jgi:hypothetical protein
MDKLIPIFGMLTGIVMTGIGVWGIVRVFQGPVGQAISRWIGSQSGQFGNPELASDVAALREQVEHLQQQLVDAHERIDFTERLLARGREGVTGGGD